MFYVNPSTLEIVTLDELKILFPNVSFGNQPNDDFITNIGLVKYDPFVGEPEYDKLSEIVYQDGIIYLDDEDKYVPNYVVRELNEDELNRNKDIQWTIQRENRDKMINDLMWMFERYNTQKLANLTTTNTDQEIEELAMYIQDLRDMTDQEDPHQLNWPEIPLFLNPDINEDELIEEVSEE